MSEWALALGVALTAGVGGWRLWILHQHVTRQRAQIIALRTHVAQLSLNAGIPAPADMGVEPDPESHAWANDWEGPRSWGPWGDQP